MEQKSKNISKVSLLKDIVTIFRDLLVIIGTIWAFFKAPPILNEKASIAKSDAATSKEQLRTLRLANIQKLNSDILQIDEQLKDAPWKDGPTWNRLKAVRELKEREILRLESTMKED